MPWGAIAGNMAGSAIGGAFNAREAAKNRRWQRELSNTQYQRSAADMEKAGLNRILALGAPASTPSGATASMEAPQPGSTGIAAASAKQAIAQGKAQEELLKAQNLETIQKTRLTSAEAAKAEVQKGLYEELGPTAEKAFQAIGDSVRTFAESPGRIIDENIVQPTKNAGRAVIDNLGPGYLINPLRRAINRTREARRATARQPAETPAPQFRQTRRGRRRVQN